MQEDITSINGKHIVVTGDFDFGSRPEVCSFIEKVGGIIDNSVKKTTDYVVVGNKGSLAWKTGNYGGKIQKAIELKDKGANIETVQEDNFIEAVNYLLEFGEPDNLESAAPLVADADDDYDWKQAIKDMRKQ